MAKVTSDLILSVLRDGDRRPLGVHEILARCGLAPGARTAVKRQLRELVRARLLTGEGKRYALREGAALPSVQGPHLAPGEPPRERPRAPPATPGESPVPKAVGPGQQTVQRLLRGFQPQSGAKGRAKHVIGVLQLKAQGYGFVSRVSGPGEDVFLPADEARGLADGDLVEVEIVERQGGRSAGKLVGLIERRRRYAVGRYQRRGGGAMVEPLDRDLPPFPVQPVPFANEGDAVRVRLPEHSSDDAVVEAVVGAATDPRIESLSVAYSKGFSDVFSAETLAEAEAFPGEVTEAQRRGRRDLTGLPLVTIDGEDARDFDDAVYVEPAADGTRLLVAIADVASYVTAGSALDVDALSRCTSVYFPDRVLPMLPERLSNGLCSLMPEVDRLCLVADMVIDRQGETRRTEIYPAVMRSAARCTYTQVADSLAGKPVDLPERVTQRFPAMRELAETLQRMRERRGAIDFNLTELKIVLGANGRISDVVPRERNPAHRLIESFMLAANEAVAQHFLRLHRSSIYRIHDQPNEEKLESFLELARAYGFNNPLGQIPRPQVLNDFLRKLDVGPGEKARPEARALNALLLRSMMQAAYAENNIGHYGLGAPGYLHFTSPIRRYPDLMVHRLLWQEWHRQDSPNEGELSAVARRCSERERAAMSAEREIDSFYGALWASEHVGERFHGTIDGATPLGLFVEIDGHLVSGLVSAQGLGSEAELEPKAHRYRLGRTGKTLGIGDPLEVEILSANVARRQIDLGWVGAPQQAPGFQSRGRLLDRPFKSVPERPKHQQNHKQDKGRQRSGGRAQEKKHSRDGGKQEGRQGGRPGGQPGRSHDKKGRSPHKRRRR